MNSVERESAFLLTRPILARMNAIEGWFSEEEADLLIAVAAQALRDLPASDAIVEVGSYCGRSTVVLGVVAKKLSAQTKIYAIDPHAGEVGAADQRISKTAPTLETFRRNIADAGLADIVVAITQHSYDVRWDRPIKLLFIDGLHDYFNVARDLHHFEPWLVDGAYVAFHDYADYYPGVKAFVDELLNGSSYERVHCVGSLMVVRKLGA